MRSFQTIAILFLFGNFVGCTPVEQTNTIPLQFENKEKDKYIEKVEQIVSESASALTAISGSLAEGNVRRLVQGQVIRLSGVSKPSVAKVEEYSRMLNQNDSKAIQRDIEEAQKTDAETDALYALVDARDKEIAEANSRAEVAEKKLDIEFKQKILWLLTCVGMGVSTGGLLVIAFTPWKTRGLILIAGGATAVASVWVLSSAWFQYILISIAVLGVLDLLWLVLRWQLRKRSAEQGELQKP